MASILLAWLLDAPSGRDSGGTPRESRRLRHREGTQVRKSQILNDLRALAERCELLLGDVDSDDPNGDADHGGGGGQRDLLSEYLVESRHLLGGVVAVHGDYLEEAIRLVTACQRQPRGRTESTRAQRPALEIARARAGYRPAARRPPVARSRGWPQPGHGA